MDVQSPLYLDTVKSSEATSILRLRFDSTNGLHPGAKFTDVAKVLSLMGEAWWAPKVQQAAVRLVELQLKTAYDEDGERIERS